MMNALIARNSARSAVRTRPNVARTAPVRKYASEPGIPKNPLPPPLGKAPLEAGPETKGSTVPMLVGGVLAAAGLGWYYYAFKSTDEAADVKQNARELEQAARVQTQEKINEGRGKYYEAKADGRAKIDSAQSNIQSSYNSAANKASSAAAEAQARLASYKDATEKSVEQSKEKTEKAARDARAFAEDKAKQAQNSWWSWFGWGKAKGEDAKEKAAAEAAKGAREVKETAADAEESAQRKA